MSISFYFQDKIANCSALEDPERSIAVGRKRGRLSLPHLPQYAVAVEVIRHETFSGQARLWTLSMTGVYYPIAENVLINTKSLAKRWNISSQTIEKAIKGDYLDELVRKTMHSFETMLSSYVIKDKTVYTQEGKNLLLSPKKLYRSLRCALDNDPGQTTLLFDEVVIAHKDDEDPKQIHLFCLLDDPPIGKGSYGKVKPIIDLLSSDETGFIIKMTKSNLRQEKAEKGKKYLVNEYNILRLLHGGKKPTQIGIQDPPYIVVSFSNGQAGYLAPRYSEGNLQQQLTKMSLPEKLQCIHQLLLGLKACSDKQIRHGDIKLSNCLVRKSLNGIECAIGDFGGAALLCNPDGGHNDKALASWGVSSRENMCQQDMNTYNLLACNNDLLPKEKCQLLNLQKARDVFALGSTFNDMIDDRYPLELSYDLQDLIDNMTHPNYVLRISSDQALKKFLKLHQAWKERQNQDNQAGSKHECA